MDRQRLVDDRAHDAGWCLNVVRAAAVEAAEEVLVVVDEPLAEQGSQLTAAVRDAGAQPRLALWAGRRPLERPPAAILSAAREVDVVVFLAQEPLADEAGARMQLSRAVTERGGREIYSAFVDRALLEGELSRPAPDLREPAEQLLGRLRGADELRVRGHAGTDLTLRLGERPWTTDVHPLRRGEFANYPSGEVFVSPLEDSADGILVADLTVPYTVDGLVDAPVTLRFAAGRVTEIDGGRAAELLRGLVREAGEGADVVAELGIGLNPAIAPRGHILLDEKAAATAHVAIGSNLGVGGGRNRSSIHVDCVFSQPRIEADGAPVQLP